MAIVNSPISSGQDASPPPPPPPARLLPPSAPTDTSTASASTLSLSPVADVIYTLLVCHLFNEIVSCFFFLSSLLFVCLFVSSSGEMCSMLGEIKYVKRWIRVSVVSP